MAIQKIHESFVYAAMAGADLSGSLNLLGKIDTDGEIILATAGSHGFPIIEAAAAGYPATIQFGGIGKAIAAGSFNAGVALASDGSGKLTTAGGGVEVVGIALTPGSANEVVSYIIIPAPSP